MWQRGWCEVPANPLPYGNKACFLLKKSPKTCLRMMLELQVPSAMQAGNHNPQSSRVDRKMAGDTYSVFQVEVTLSRTEGIRKKCPGYLAES